MAQRAERKKSLPIPKEKPKEQIKTITEDKPYQIIDSTIDFRRLIKECISHKNNIELSDSDEFKIRNKYLGKKGIYAINIIDNVFILCFNDRIERNKILAKNIASPFSGETSKDYNQYFKDGLYYIIPFYCPIIKDNA